MKNNKLITVLGLIGLYLLITGISYTVFSKNATREENITSPKVSKTNNYEALEFDEDSPKTEECPLNGARYSKSQRKWWEGHRPLGVMIENHEEARPQSGLSFADVIYEAVAEGGITRFLAIYYCQDAGIVGPIRSARTYFLDWISEYGDYPLYAHVGGANTPGPADALGQIIAYGWSSYNDLNQFSIGFPTFRRDESRLGHPVATEHTMYSTTSKLWKVAAQRGLTEKDREGNIWSDNFVQYSFKDDAKESARGDSQVISVSFWANQPKYDVVWRYDKSTNSYKRENGGKPHLDNNNDLQINAKNIVILFMQETNANDGYPGNLHLLYKNKGRGKALIFQDGKQIIGTWRKDNRESRTEIIGPQGSEIEFTRGTIWFQIVPIGAKINVD